MRVFVFGAGASLHVGYPLTKALCSKLMEWASKNEPANQLYWPNRDELSRFGSFDDIEELVSQVEKVSKPGPILEGLRNGLCGYFDSIRANHAALYRQLAQEIVEPGDVVVSFNYDVSLDRELQRAGKWNPNTGYGFSVGMRGLPPSGTTLLKLHGSTNWMDSLFDGLRGGQFSQGSDSHGPRPVLLPQELEFLGCPPETRDPRFNGGGMLRNGSMILPSRDKRFYVGTSTNSRERGDFWSSLWHQAAMALREAREISVIGYSFPSADKDARELLLNNSNRRCRLAICSGSDTTHIREQFVSAGFLPERIVDDSRYFEEWIEAECSAAVSSGSTE
jgi:hypothetical protein